MRDGEKGLILIGLLLWLAWRREEVTTVLYKDCTLEDGTVVQVPIDQECP